MPFDLADAEALAQRELRLACLDGHDAPPWRTLLSRRGVRVARYDSRSPIYRASGVGAPGLVNGTRTAYVWDGLNERDTAYTACHEWCHLIVSGDGLELACPLEAFCNRFAAAVLTPADSARRAWKAAPRDLLAMHALRPQTSASVLTMRVGELGLAPIALYDRKAPRYFVGVQRSRALDRLVAEARREGYAANDCGRAWRLPDNEARVGVLVAA